MRGRLMEILTSEGKLTEQQIKAAFVRQARKGGRIGSHLVELGYISEDDLAEALSRLYRKPSIGAEVFDRIDPALKELVPADVAYKYRAIPLKLRGRTLVVAMENPNDLEAIEELRFMTGHRIQSLVCPQIRLEHGLEKFYGIKGRYGFLRPPERAARQTEVAEAAGERRDGGFLDIEDRLGGNPIGRGALHMLKADSLDSIGESLLISARSYAWRVIIFGLRSGESVLIGWKAAGGGLNDFVVRDHRIRLSSIKGLIERLQAGRYYHGSPDGLPAGGGFFKDVCGEEVREMFLVPIFFKGRVLLILYADNGSNAIGGQAIENLLGLASICSMAVEMLGLRKKIHSL